MAHNKKKPASDMEAARKILKAWEDETVTKIIADIKKSRLSKSELEQRSKYHRYLNGE
ncbi:hypothetical protein [Alicyclobacillus acidiphilus]|uniref:hypothetical protein n=1 Tax=Alicyclobacillus acidiphilus TaxID=182455 RepID=UPI000B03202A|nr:hypothetical protein [Alicyclobacillus acidiphilus]